MAKGAKMVDWGVGPRWRELARRRRVLVVDEDEYLVALLRKIVEETGLLCDGFSEPRIALSAFRIDPYDIVVVDPKMLEFDAIEFLRGLKEFREGVAVVLITAWLDRERLRQFMRLGAVDYLIKPFKSRKLIDAIYRGLHMLALREDLRTYRSRNLDPGPYRGASRRHTLY